MRKEGRERGSAEPGEVKGKSEGGWNRGERVNGRKRNKYMVHRGKTDGGKKGARQPR